VLAAAREWLGKRRRASVRALTSVTVVVLNVADMQWAVEHDYRLCHELTDAMKRQRKVRAVRRRAGETQREGCRGGSGAIRLASIGMNEAHTEQAVLRT
jgi:CRP-like cAMP-binding protein